MVLSLTERPDQPSIKVLKPPILFPLKGFVSFTQSPLLDRSVNSPPLDSYPPFGPMVLLMVCYYCYHHDDTSSLCLVTIFYRPLSARKKYVRNEDSYLEFSMKKSFSTINSRCSVNKWCLQILHFFKVSAHATECGH